MHPLLSPENLSILLDAFAFVGLMALSAAGLWVWERLTERRELKRRGD